MAKAKMMCIELVALLRDSKSIIELMQRRGAVQLRDSLTDRPMERFDTARSVAMLDKHRALAERALLVLDEYAPAKKAFLAAFDGRKRLALSEFSDRARQVDETMRRAYDLLSSKKKIEDARAEILCLNAQIDALRPWQALDIPMSFRGTEHTRVFFGTLPGLFSRESVLKTLEKDFPDELLADIEILFASKEQSCVFAIAHKKIAERLENALRALGLSRVFDPSASLPRRLIEKHEEKIAALKAEMDASVKKIEGSAGLRERLLFAMDHFTLRMDKYRALEELALTENTFVLSGYAPKEKAAALADELRRRYTLAISLTEPSEGDEPPVYLKNNAFVAPLEDITASYSLPSENDVDPNAAMAFFYYLFFGIMLSDAGYGLLIVIVTGLLLKFKRPEGSLKLNLQKFFLCGLSTVFWGALFGSWFGNIVNVVSVTYFGGGEVIRPLWFDPVTDPMRLLIFSTGLGFVHVVAGLCVKFYMLWKDGKRLDALFDVGLWWVVFAGLLCIIADMQFKTSVPLGTVGAVISIAAAVGLVLTQGRASPSLAGKIIGGIGSLYDITGYFSDVLSYCRLMALGLVTGIIGSVVNTIGNLMGASVGGALLLLFIFAAGHAVNLAINLLGAYVHCNRLQYVEFFSKFYEGGGKPFRPLAVNTDYYTFEEENNHV